MLGGFRKLVDRIRPGVDAELLALLERLSQGWSGEAFERITELASAGHVDAQYHLGRMYETAEGVVQNLADAVYWYRRAAEQGHPVSQARLGLIYFIEPPPAAGVDVDGTASKGNREGGGKNLSETDDSALGGTLSGSFPHGYVVKRDLVEAAKWNRLASAAGIAGAQARYGHQLALGLGVMPNLAEAERYLRTSADQDDLGGMAGLGVLLAGGYGGKVDYNAAYPWLRRAADGGNATAQYWLAQLLLTHALGPRDERQALVLLRAAAEQGHAVAMYALGMALWRGKPEHQDEHLAESWLRRSALRGQRDAKRALAELLSERPGDNGSDSANFLRQAADEGDTRAAALLAELYLRGHGCPRDVLEASRWLGVAGSDAREEACSLLAAFYAEGVGVNQSYGSAAEWLRLAARRGSISAQYNLGSLHRQGKGVARDPIEAAQWYRKAAEAGSAQAAFDLGVLHSEPKSSLRSDSEAAAWFRIAMERGHGIGLCNFALMVMEGRGISRSFGRGLQLLEDGAQNGCVHAAELLVDVYSRGEHAIPNFERAAYFLAKAVELGSVFSTVIALDAKQRGIDLPIDLNLLRTAIAANATQGDAASQRAFGELLCLEASESPILLIEAREWIARAAERGDMLAQVWMGDCARTGLVGSTDTVAAKRWYRLSAGQGHIRSLEHLAELTSTSEEPGSGADIECFGLWLAAAEAGYPHAQRRVGECYLAGRGCRPDLERAVWWLRAAALQGDQDAERLLVSCAPASTPSEPDTPSIALLAGSATYMEIGLQDAV